MIKRLAAGGVAVLALTGMSATGAAASTAGSRPALATKVTYLKMHGTTAKITIRGDWRLAHVKIPSTALPHPRTIKAGSAQSGNWGGYVETGHNVAFRFVAANFTAPNVNCSNSPAGSSGVADVAGWTGLDGFSDATVEQDGFAEICEPSSSPVQSWYAWYEVYPDDAVAFAGVNPGDALVSSVYYNSSTQEYSLTVNDLTQNSAGFTVEIGCPSGNSCNNSSAEVISEVSNGGPAFGYNLADYGAMEFTNGAVTSRAGTRGNLGKNSLWSPTSITTVGTGDTMQTAGPLQGNTAFLESWLNAS
jgi:Peptidase A4 family